MLPGDQDRPVAAEAEALGGRRGEVELAAADVRAAVDDADADRAARWRNVTLVPHGSVLWATPSCAVAEAAAAAERLP